MPNEENRVSELPQLYAQQNLIQQRDYILA